MLGCASSSPPTKTYTHTERARMLVEIANGSLIEGDPTGALQSLVRAEEEDANLPELYHSKALAFFAKHDLDSAIKAANKAVELKPNYADANNTLGKLLMDAGKYQEAIPPLKTAAGDHLYREAYKANTNLGILKYRLNQMSEAEKYFNQAIQDSPQVSCTAYYYRGHIEMKNSHFKDAAQFYKKATQKVCANFGDAYLALGLAFQQDHQYNEARKTFLDIQKRYPNTKIAERAFDQLRYLP